MQSKLQGLTVKDVEVDEIWGYVGKKEGYKSDDDGRELAMHIASSAWKPGRNWYSLITLGKRTAKSTDAFIGKLAYATPRERYQLTSDGFKPYVSAVKLILRDRVDFAQLVKVYCAPRDGEQRYSPAEVVDSVLRNHGTASQRQDLHVAFRKTEP